MWHACFHSPLHWLPWCSWGCAKTRTRDAACLMKPSRGLTKTGKSPALSFLLTVPAGLVLVPKQAGVWYVLANSACIPPPQIPWYLRCSFWHISSPVAWCTPRKFPGLGFSALEIEALEEGKKEVLCPASLGWRQQLRSHSWSCHKSNLHSMWGKE